MSDRPTKEQLLLKFFPELVDASGSAGDKEASIRLNAQACEVVLADQIVLFDQGFKAHGPGCLALRLFNQQAESSYLPLADLQGDLQQARKSNDFATGGFLSEVIEAINSHDLAGTALLLLIDNSRAQILPINREYPAKAIERAMERQVAHG